MAKPMAKKDEQVDIIEIKQDRVKVGILGDTPLIEEAMSVKVMGGLLNPRGRLTAVDKASRPKHSPLDEYRESIYRMPEGAPSIVGIKAAAFKKAMMGATADMPDATRAGVGRRVHVVGDLVAVYGIPLMMMAVVRSADMKRSADVRTRAVLREWGCILEIVYTRPLMTAQNTLALLSAAGVLQGVGGWRPEKGSGTFGQFSVVDHDDPRLTKLMKAAGRVRQVTALDEPAFYDSETAQLYAWHCEQMEKRAGAAPAKVARGNGAQAQA